jgi:hypothetical protein
MFKKLIAKAAHAVALLKVEAASQPVQDGVQEAILAEIGAKFPIFWDERKQTGYFIIRTCPTPGCINRIRVADHRNSFEELVWAAKLWIKAGQSHHYGLCTDCNERTKNQTRVS